MSAITIQQMADRVAGLMEDRLRIRGAGLSDKLARGGRSLPRRVRKAAEVLAEAAQMSQNPRLLLQINHEHVAEAYDTCLRYLAPLGAGARRVAMLTGIVAQVGFGLVVMAAALLLVLKVRGAL
jgi:hypothetical protein